MDGAQRRGRRKKRVDPAPEDWLTELIKEARIAGADFFGVIDWTPGEALEFVDIINERKRREAQQEAVIFFSTVAANSRIMAGETLFIEEAYPFWNEEETNKIRKERLKAKARSMREAMRANMDIPEEENDG